MEQLLDTHRGQPKRRLVQQQAQQTGRSSREEGGDGAPSSEPTALRAINQEQRRGRSPLWSASGQSQEEGVRKLTEKTSDMTERTLSSTSQALFTGKVISE